MLASVAALCATTACNTKFESRASASVQETENLLTITEKDVIRWNGAAVTLDQLEVLLSEAAEMEPQPQLRFEPDLDSSYETSVAVLERVKEAGITKFGFVGNEKYRTSPEGD